MSVSTSSKDHAGDYFVETVYDSFLVPLHDELASAIVGYEDMDYHSRFASVIMSNSPQYGVGDCLPFGGALVFAGVKLGKDREVGKVGSGPAAVSVEQYQPRFSDRRQLVKAYALAPEWGMPAGATSKLHEFLSGGTVPDYDTGEAVSYESLPAAYKAALLSMYLSANIVAPSWMVESFILGVGGNGYEFMLMLRGRGDYDFSPAYNAFGRPEGWHVRLHDTQPSNKIRNELFKTFRHARPKSDFEVEQESIGRRAPHKGPERACEWLYEYEQVLKQEGKHLGRGGVSYRDALAKMQTEAWEIGKQYKDPDSLGRQYRRFKDRKGYE